MPAPTKSALSLLDVSPDDIAKFPRALKEKIAEAFGRKSDLTGEWLLVGAGEDWQAKLVKNTVRALPRIATARRTAISETHIEKLVEILLDDAPRAEIDQDLEFDNARMRADYLREVPTMTGVQVRAASGLEPQNTSEPASRWKREGRIFAVRHKGLDLYPAFQFEDGAPMPAMRRILAALPDDLTPWQICFWFASGNGWLDGATPQERLDTPDAVAAAAERLATPAVG